MTLSRSFHREKLGHKQKMYDVTGREKADLPIRRMVKQRGCQGFKLPHCGRHKFELAHTRIYLLLHAHSVMESTKPQWVSITLTSTLPPTQTQEQHWETLPLPIHPFSTHSNAWHLDGIYSLKRPRAQASATLWGFLPQESLRIVLGCKIRITISCIPCLISRTGMQGMVMSGHGLHWQQSPAHTAGSTGMGYINLI